MSLGEGTNTLLRRHNRLVPSCVAALGLLLLASRSELSAENALANTGQVAWSAVARLAVNPVTGNTFVYGYLTQVIGMNGPFFNGAPSQATAYFTLRSNVAQEAPLPANGDINLTVIQPWTFSIYLNSNPHGDWSNPDSFSSGRLVATFARRELLLTQIGSIAYEKATSVLTFSQDFIFQDQTVNFRRLAPAVTITNLASSTPLPVVLPGFPIVLPFSGYAVVDRNSHEDEK